MSNKLIGLLLAIQFLGIYLDQMYVTSFLIVLLLGLVIFGLRVMGAGDIKYAAVLALTLPTQWLLPALVLTALSGGVLAAIYLTWFKFRQLKGIQVTAPGLPYGVAISLGFYFPILNHYLTTL
ncbi:type IV prepilin peptidase TadV/CpaA [Vibrio variabilis]|uniref:Type IV prepilin peptidase TadV/CpaA n=1 Tax=Vibrio variabilis TaxID=990271 RepID=A0ABQ0JJ60_9VIBR|nr:type IV prepilin peptidase TadV/CpaA [Vibrio variabilis]